MNQPAWPGAPADGGSGPAPRSVWQREVDIKLVVAVLIGLVSVTGAVLTWRASQLSEQATDKDRQAIAETVTLQQLVAEDEVNFNDERARFAVYVSNNAAADALEDQAAAVPDALADQLFEQADELRREADRLIAAGLAPLSFIDYTLEQPDGTFNLDEEALREDLRAISAEQAQVDPENTAADAEDLRSESERLVFWIIPLVAAIVLLTFAQIVRQRLLRLGFTGLATAVWLTSTLLALAGD